MSTKRSGAYRRARRRLWAKINKALGSSLSDMPERVGNFDTDQSKANAMSRKTRLHGSFGSGKK